MSRALVLALLFAADAALFAAGPPGLLVAIRNGDYAEAQKLLSAGADVNVVDADGTTALMHSVIESDVKMMKLLVDGGAGVNAKNAFDSTALMYAATDLAKTRLLLDRGADVKVTGKRGATPLSIAAASFASTPILKLFIAGGAPPEDRLMALVAAKGDLGAIRYLLSIGVSAGDATGATVSAAITGRCEACARLLVDKGAPVNGLRPNGAGVLNDTAKRAMPELSQFLLDHGASLDSKDREGFTLLMQAVLSMEAPASRDRMVQWLLSKGVDPNARNERGDTAYQLAARVGIASTLELLVKAGAKAVKEEWPQPSGVALSAQAAVQKILPLVETGGEPVFKNRSCVSCHNNSLPAMTVALARNKGFTVNEEQARKELGFAVATDTPYLEPMRLGSTIGGGAGTLGYTLMGMAAAGYPADALTDAHIHYLSMYQFPEGFWRTNSYRPPEEYSALTTTAVVLRAIKLYPIPGRRAEFEERVARAKRWLLSEKAFSQEERSMQLNALADAGASASEREPYLKALKAAQNQDGSWSQLPGSKGEAYATGEALYALHVSGNLPSQDPAYRKGVQWLLRNQLADGSWFVPTRAVPVQPHTFETFPHGWHQFASAAGSNWAAMALLFALQDRPPAKAILAPTGTLRAVFLGDNPVQGRVDAGTGVPTGPAPDLVKELAGKIGVPYRIMPAPDARAVMDALKNHTADIGFLAYDESRAREVDYGAPFAVMFNSYLVGAGSPIRSSAEVDRAGVKVAAVKGQTQELFISSHLKNAQVRIFQTMPPQSELEKLLTSGELNAFAINRQRSLDAQAASSSRLRALPDSFLEVEQSFVVEKGASAAKLEVIEKFVAEVRASGFIKASIERANLTGVGVAPGK